MVDAVLRWESEPNAPWILWRRQEDVAALLRQNLHEDLDFTSYQYDVDIPVTACSAPKIKRTQYHSIVNRIDQAKKQSGQYASWMP